MSRVYHLVRTQKALRRGSGTADGTPTLLMVRKQVGDGVVLTGWIMSSLLPDLELLRAMHVHAVAKKIQHAADSDMHMCCLHVAAALLKTDKCCRIVVLATMLAIEATGIRARGLQRGTVAASCERRMDE